MIAAVGLGSNLGDREANLNAAVERLGELGEVVGVSGFHDTEPVGFVEQPRFLNAAALVETEMGAGDLMRALLQIELDMGRDRTATVAKGPRVIDLDLLLFGDAVVSEAGVEVPHPAMHERGFVLAPLSEIAGGMVHPVRKKTVAEMLGDLGVGEGQG